MQRKLKTTITTLLVVSMLLANSTIIQAKYTPLTESTVISQDNSVDLDAKVTSVKKVKKGKHKGQRKLSFVCTSKGRHKGHVYTIYLSKFAWKVESFERNENIRATLYKCGTKKVTDDIVINVSGERYKILHKGCK